MRELWHRMEAAAARRPGAALALFAWISALLWALQSALFRRLLPLDGVESVCWGSRLQWGYFKHPPLAAWLAWGAARLTGYADFAQYLLTYGSIAVGVCFVYLLARECLSPQRAALAAMPLYFLHYYTLAPTAFCPNSIQLALQPVMAWLFLRCLRHGRLRTWIALGVVSAAAFLGKYSAGILLLAMAVSVLAIPQWRRRLASLGPWLSGIIFMGVVAPHLLWLVRNDFICLLYVEESIQTIGALQRLWFPFYMLLAALYPLLVAAVLYLLAGLPALPRGGDALPSQNASPWEKDFRRYAILLTAVPAAIVVLLAALGHSVQPMWLSTMASWCPLAVMLLFPWQLPEGAFLRIFRLLCIGTAIALIASSVDYMVRSRPRSHLDVEALCRAADECMATSAGQGGGEEEGTLAIVVGERLLANSLQYYHPDHPFSADMRDPLAMVEVAERLKALRDAGRPAALLLVGKRPWQLAACLDIAATHGVYATPVGRLPMSVSDSADTDTARKIPFHACLGKTRQLTLYMMRCDVEAVRQDDGVMEDTENENRK